MTPKLILDNFEKLADAPNGITKLRELILQLAVQGKLVPQDPKDEPASVLLEKIKAEKENLIKEGKIKKQKALPPIESDEISYGLPKGWEWQRIREICHDWGQKKPDTDFTYIDVASIDKENGVISDNVQYLDSKSAPSRARKIVKKGTVIYSTVRPYLLNIAVVEKDYDPEPIASTAFAIVHPFNGVEARFLHYYFRSITFVRYVESKMIGMAYPAINDRNFFAGLVPLPPSSEQKRIVTRVDELMALCDELEEKQRQRGSKLVAFNDSAVDHLTSASTPAEFKKHFKLICENFDTLYDNPDNVKKLRQAILQLAVQGKLVPQTDKDEPASELLKKIKTEKEKIIKEGKIKKQKQLPPIAPNEIPWDSPKSWTWVRMEEITQKLGAGSTPKGGKAVYCDSGIKFLRSQNVYNHGLKLDGVAHISSEIHERMNGTAVEAGDILLNITGASIARSSLVPDDFDEANVNQHVAIVRLVDKNLRRFIHKVAISPYVYDLIMGVQVGISREGLSMARLKEFVIPIPPLAEQKRIVKKVDELMSLCDELEKQITESQTKSQHLMSATVHNLLAG